MQTQHDWDDESQEQERLWLSESLDGESSELPPTPQLLEADWAVYQLIGDVLRSPGLADPVPGRLSARVMAALDDEPPLLAPAPWAAAVAPAAITPAVAVARRPGRRWRQAVPGLAIAATVAAVVWQMPPTPGSGGASGRLAQHGAAPVVAVAQTPRRARTVEPALAEYFDAHWQVAGMTGASRAAFGAP